MLQNLNLNCPEYIYIIHSDLQFKKTPIQLVKLKKQPSSDMRTSRKMVLYFIWAKQSTVFTQPSLSDSTSDSL